MIESGRTEKQMTSASGFEKKVRGEVAFLIVYWLGERCLEKSLACVLAQQDAAADVFVLDNGSKAGLSEDIQSRFPSVRFIRSEVNLGFAGGNNRLLKEAIGYPWIALVNPDAFLEPDWLAQMLKAAAANSQYSFFASRLIRANDPAVLDGEGDAVHVSGLAWRIRHGLALKREVKKPKEVFSACAAAALYRSEGLSEAGGFDEDYFCYFEDVDLGFRLRLLGRRCLFVPEAVAHHVGSASTGGRHSDMAVYYGHRNLVWTYVKNMPGLLLWFFLPLHLLLNFVSISWFAVQGKGRMILKAKLDACRMLPLMWKKRRPIQEARRASTAVIWKMLDKSLLPKIRSGE